MSELREIRLYGVLGQRFGRVHRFAIRTPAEGLRAIRANHRKEFDSLMPALAEAPFRVYIGDEPATYDRLLQPFGREVVRIVPVIQGGKDELFGIIIGAALILAAGPIGGALGGSLISAATTTAAVNAVGWGLVLGGVSSLLFRPPTPQSSDPVQNQPSYAFDGAVNTVAQGNCVPWGYGRAIIGSQTISLGLFSEDYSTAAPPNTSKWAQAIVTIF